MASTFASPAASPAAAPAAPAAAPVSSPAAAPSGASVETFSESDLTPTPIMDELSAALDGDAPPPAEEAAPPAPVDDADAPPADAEAAAAPPVDAAAPPAVAAPAQLPEGVKLRSIDGKPQWVMDPKMGETLTARAGLVDAAEKAFGGPLTKETIDYHQSVAEGFEGMRGDLLSDNPADQANVVAHFEDVIKRAAAKGEIGHDALSSFAQVVIDRALSGDPATAQAVEKHITRHVINGLYDEALRTHDPVQAKHLWNSAQQADKASFGEYRPSAKFDEGRAAAPPARFQPRQAPAPANPSGALPAEARAKAEFQTWNQTTNSKIHTSAVESSVDQVLTDIPAEQRKAFPGLYDFARDRLLKAVKTGVQTDPQLRQQVDALQKRARQAVNPEVRNQIADEIVRRHADKASQILKDKKGPILSEYAQAVSAKSNDQTRRVNAGAQAGRNAAPGGGPSASRSNPQPPKTAKFESADDQAFGKELDAAFA